MAKKGRVEVFSSDGVLLGEVTHIWSDADMETTATSGAVDRGPIVKVTGESGPLYIPLRAIASRSDERLTLTRTADEIASLPWRYRPEGLPTAREGSLLDQIPAILNNPQTASTRYI